MAHQVCEQIELGVERRTLAAALTSRSGVEFDVAALERGGLRVRGDRSWRGRVRPVAQRNGLIR